MLGGSNIGVRCEEVVGVMKGVCRKGKGGWSELTGFSYNVKFDIQVHNWLSFGS